jgi:hypothetical protein
LVHLSKPKLFLVYVKNLSIPKNLRTPKTNFEEADGLGIRNEKLNVHFQDFQQVTCLPLGKWT